MTVKKIYLILQMILCILLVIILSFTAISIYRDGLVRKAENPLAWIYSREIVEEKLRSVTPLLFASVGMGLAGLILDVKDDDADKPVKDAELSRDLIVSHVAEPNEQMKKEQNLQKKLLWGGWIAFAACSVPIAIYLLNGSHFPDGDLEAMIAALAAHVLPWMALAVACLMISTVLQERSILRETEAAQARLKEEKAEGITAEVKKGAVSKRNGTVQLVLVAVAVILIIAGVFNGSAQDVLYKAVKICTECVGLG